MYWSLSKPTSAQRRNFGLFVTLQSRGEAESSLILAMENAPRLASSIATRNYCKETDTKLAKRLDDAVFAEHSHEWRKANNRHT